MLRSLITASVILLVLGQATPATAIDLQPYRAVYDLTLSRANSGSGIVGLTGRMVLEWADACEGYTLLQRMGFRLSQANSTEILSDVNVATWESKDGTAYRYSMRTTMNGVVTEEYRGRASVRGPGEGGTATFAKPDGMKVTLPPGTLFPTLHTRVLVERALEGDQRVARKIFEGSAGDTIYEAVAFVGKRMPADHDGGQPKSLRGLTSWQVNIAFFTLGDDGDVPEYEVGMRLFANGIGTDVKLDYGDFIVDAALTDLELLPYSGC